MKVGDVIRLKGGGEAKILSEFGTGGQGTVYRVSCEGKEYALKWYHPGALNGKDTQFYQNLENNIAKGAPTKAFLWPINITERHQGTFGYIMPIRPDGYEELTSFFVGSKKKRQVRFKSFRAIADAAIQIIDAFRELHNNGYSYQDINNGNFFINPLNGDVLICDNDNVSPYGTNLGIMGKQRWMAPEVVTGEKDPDKLSDRFSLAVVLFRLLFINHPLEGRYSTPPCMTKELEKKFYGSEPIFIYDPDDSKNRPIAGTDHNLKMFWKVYPQYIKDAFIHSFSQKALHEREFRLLEKEWLNLFMQLRAETGRCPYCHQEMFYHTENGSDQAVCFECHKTVRIQNFLNIKGRRYPAYRGMQLKLWDVDSSIGDTHTTMAEVVANPNKPNLLGYQNQGQRTWVVELPDGSRREVPTGKPVPVKKGLTINFLGLNGGKATIE